MTPGQTAELAERIRRAESITVLTGAGVSVASGVPTFRGAEGLWKDFRPEELATPDAFLRDPKKVWEWYNERRVRVLSIKPNRAHEVLAAWSRRYPGFSLVTQNVDGLHERAGALNVIRLHGSLMEVGCWKQCVGSPYRWLDETIPYPEIPPRCPCCGDLIRPGVVWFGENLDPVVWLKAEAALECDLFFSIGTSSVVYPAAQLIPAAKRRGAFVVEINPDPSDAAAVVDAQIAEKAESALDQIEARLLAIG